MVRRLVTALVLVGALVALSPARARTGVRYVHDETIVLERTWRVVTYRDLDRDDRPDLVVTTGDQRRIEIYERTGDGFAAVAAIPTPAMARSSDAIGDLDGDGFVEVVFRGHRSGDLYVVEATEDDRYALGRFVLGALDDATCIADTDDDGRPEIVASQPGFPSRVHRIEVMGEDRHERLPVLEGIGGSVWVACAAPGRADPLRLVYVDNHFWSSVHRATWVDATGARGQWPRLGFFPAALADTDGDGRGELVGRDRVHDAPLGLVIAYVPDRAPPEVVVHDPEASCPAPPTDHDGDGRSELLCTREVDGMVRVEILVRRADRLVRIWDSEDQLGASSAPTRAHWVPDRNGDGRPEILVVRGGPTPLLHVLTSAPPG